MSKIRCTPAKTLRSVTFARPGRPDGEADFARAASRYYDGVCCVERRGRRVRCYAGGAVLPRVKRRA